MFDESFQSVVGPKVNQLRSREPVCKTCNLDPINRITEELRAAKAGDTTMAEVDTLIDDIVTSSAAMRASLDKALLDQAADNGRRRHRGPSIPLRPV